MKRVFLPFIPILAACLLSGCVSHVGVTKVTPGSNPRGLRYYLPMPVVVGKPAPDGKIIYSVELIPDMEHEYAVNSWSFMAKHKADIARDAKMLLTKVELSQDSTAVASKLLESAGKVGEQMATSAGENRSARREAANAANTDLRAKEQAVKTAAQQVKFAEQDLKSAQLSGNQELAASAQVALTAAKREVEKAALQETFAKKEAGRFDDPGLTTGGSSGGSLRGLAAGPVIYRIVEDPFTGGVRLEPMNFKLRDGGSGGGQRQIRFQTVKAPSAPAGDGTGTGGTAAKSDDPEPRIRLSPGATVFMDQRAVVNLRECQVAREDSPDEEVSDLFELRSASEGHGLFIKRKDTTPAGLYRVKISFRVGNGGNQSKTRLVEVK
ncbi:MAG: hypothetical protein V4726_00220 [Verrucomicrobiota bacterium]